MYMGCKQLRKQEKEYYVPTLELFIEIADFPSKILQ